MGRGGGGGGSHGGGGRSGGSHGGSFRSSSSGGRSVSRSSSGRSSSSFGHSSYRPSVSGGYYPPRRSSVHVYHYGGGYGGSRMGCLPSIIVTIAILVFCLAIIGFMSGGGTKSITTSTIERESLDKQYVTLSNDWYDDSSMGWIASGSKLTSGLKDFYNKTGVQPYLVIVNDINGDTHPTGQEVWDYADAIYLSKFHDEGHMVFVFQCEDNGSDYTMAASTGAMAKTVVDDEALEILYDYIDYYFYSDYDEDEMFAKAFSDAAERMMHKQVPTGQVVAVVIGVVAIAFIGFAIVKSVNKRAKEKAAETERILSTPVEKFGDRELDDLKSKYD